MLIKLFDIQSIKLINLFLLKQIGSLKKNAGLFLLFSYLIKSFNNFKYLIFDYFYFFLSYFFLFLKKKLKKKKKFYVLYYIKNLKYFFFKGYKLKYFYLNFFKKISESFCLVKVIIRSHNIFVNIMDIYGNNLKLYTAGFLGFKGREKTTLLSCKDLGKSVNKFIEKYFIYVEIQFVGKRGFIKSFTESLFLGNKLKLTRILIVDNIPHGGCRLKKKSIK
jgi:ribosomal protein S11